jgi:hypothetical protein
MIGLRDADLQGGISSMLNISSPAPTRTCEGIQRRDFLKIGAPIARLS